MELLAGDPDDASRSSLYAVGLESLLDSPLGLGWGGYAGMSGEKGLSRGTGAYVHNILLDVAVDGGLIALVGICVFFGWHLLKVLRIPDSVMLLLGALFVFWVVAAQFSSDVNGVRMLWATAGVISAASARRLSKPVPSGGRRVLSPDL